MTEDHKDLSISASLRENGINVRIISRVVNALERLGASYLGRKTAQYEGEIAKINAKTKLELEIIDLIGQRTRTDIAEGGILTKAAATAHIKELLSKQYNIDSVCAAAVEFLSVEGAGSDADGSEEPLSEEFMVRFRDYSADATSDELRDRWGRVLSSEIRKPGTFTRKALRIIDEIDSDTASLFEDLCRSRFGEIIPKSLVGDLALQKQAALVGAGLIIEPGLGHVIKFDKEISSSGKLIAKFQYMDLMIVVHGEFDGRSYKVDSPLMIAPEGISSMVYSLTTEGRMIASIMNHDEKEVFVRFGQKISEYFSEFEVYLFKREQGNVFSVSTKFKK